MTNLYLYLILLALTLLMALTLYKWSKSVSLSYMRRCVLSEVSHFLPLIIFLTCSYLLARQLVHSTLSSSHSTSSTLSSSNPTLSSSNPTLSSSNPTLSHLGFDASMMRVTLESVSKNVTLKAVATAGGLGLGITVLILLVYCQIHHHITSSVRRCFSHADLFLLSVLTLILTFLGLPWASPSLILTKTLLQSSAHSEIVLTAKGKLKYRLLTPHSVARSGVVGASALLVLVAALFSHLIPSSSSNPLPTSSPIPSYVPTSPSPATHSTPPSSTTNMLPHILPTLHMSTHFLMLFFAALLLKDSALSTLVRETFAKRRFLTLPSQHPVTGCPPRPLQALYLTSLITFLLISLTYLVLTDQSHYHSYLIPAFPLILLLSIPYRKILLLKVIGEENLSKLEED